ncbi:hypothetical protein JHK82_014520 [Glycine max]|nr:hypothetical protein JHK82_014520 [Glycine max]
MALGFFALALFLFITFDSDIAPSSTASAASSEGVEVQVTYGTVLKLMHEKTKFRLHSHDVPYGSGSGQQSVTGFPSVDDSNSYWIVRPEPGTSAKQGDPIKSGTIIRLQHMRTRKWLHSHLHASPISGNLEVSCFGGESESDTGDYWKLIIEGSGKTWKQDQKIRLQHIDTGGYLHSHDKKYSRIAGGQQEVCGVREKRADNVWLAAEGVYLPKFVVTSLRGMQNSRLSCNPTRKHCSSNNRGDLLEPRVQSQAKFSRKSMIMDPICDRKRNLIDFYIQTNYIDIEIFSLKCALSRSRR